MTKPIKIKIPPELLKYLDSDPEQEVKQLLVFELYRERKITLRQAANILQLTYREMEDLLERHEIYLDFGKREFDEEMQYGFSSN